MTVSIIIPARMSSTRLPGKPLMDIGGKPMVIRVWERLRRLKGIDRIVIATPDDEIADVARYYGAAFVMTSPKCRSGTDRVAVASGAIRSDIIVNVQGDEPMMEGRNVSRAVDTLVSARGSVMSTLRCPLASVEDMNDKNAVKVVTDDKGRALYFSRSPIPAVLGVGYDFPTKASDPFGRHVGIYVFRRKFLLKFASFSRTPLETSESLEQLRALEHGFPIHVGFVKGAERSVDTQDDIQRVRGLLAAERDS